ncbi:MAG: GAF domain-containing protein [Anaerolineae bacterium]|nr:GAF domain-containing protein [Anaerolineae bacterium]
MSKQNPLRNFAERLRLLPLHQRMIIMITPLLIIGFTIQISVGRLMNNESELNRVASEQAQTIQLAANQMTVFARTLPQTVISLSNSTSLQALLNVTSRMGDDISGSLTVLERSELSQARAQALGNLASEIYQTVLRAPAVQEISVFSSVGMEVLRVERTPADSLVQIALTRDLRSLAETEHYQASIDLAPLAIHYSPISINANGQPTVYLTTSLFYRSERVGGLAIALDASAFLQYATMPGDPEELASKRLIMLDSVGRYLVDTADSGDVNSPNYEGHRFGLNPEEGATLAVREPALASMLDTPVQGVVQDEQIISSMSFNPFDEPVEGTPWTLIMLQDERAAMASMLRFGAILVALAIGLTLASVLALWRLSRYLVQPINEAAEIADRIAQGDLDLRIPVRREDETGRLAGAINSMTTRLVANLAAIEDRFTERTRDLEVASEIANIAVGVNDVETLLSTAVNLIRDRFGFYHVQVFLVDDRRENANLVASTGEAGQKLLDLNWSLGVGSESVIGRVAMDGEAVIALDTEGAAVVHRPNPHLPNTRSEMALPMRYRGEIIGALDIQSTYANAFTQEETRIFEVLANQLAIAVSNTRQMEETQRQMQRVEELNRRLTRDAWDEHMQEDPQLRRFIAADAAEALPGTISTPIAVLGEVIGTLDTTPGDDTPLTGDELALIRAVAERVSLAVENARLVTQTQRSLQETERLYQSAQIINSELPLEEMFEALYGQMGAEGDIMSLIMFGSERDADGLPRHVRMMAVGREGDEGAQSVEYDYVGGKGQYVAAQQVMVCYTADDIRAAMPGQAAERIIGSGTQSLVSTPLLASGQMLGHMFLQRNIPSNFSTREVEILESISGQMATVLYNRQLFEVVETERQTLKSVLDTMPTAVMVLDAQSREATLSNEQAQRLLGEKTSLLQLASDNRLLQTDSGESFPLEAIPAFRAIATGATSYSEDIAIRLPDGSVVDVMSNAAPILDASGNVTAVVTVFQDITELRDLQNALQDSLRETTALYESSRALSAERGIENIAQSTLFHLGTNTSPDLAYVLMTSEESSQRLEPVAAMSGPLPKENPIPYTLFHPEQTRQINVMTEKTLSDAERARLQAAGISTLVTAPLSVATEMVGWIALAYHEPQAITGDQLRFIDLLADQAAISLQNARLRQQTEESLYETGLLYETSSMMVDVNSAEDILNALIQYATSQSLAQAQLFLLRGAQNWDNPNAMAEVAATWSDGSTPDLTGMSFSSDQFPNWPDLTTTALLAVDNVQTDERISEDSRMGYAALGLQGVTIIPLEVAGQPVGAVQFGYSVPHLHTDREVRIYQNLAELATIALRNIELLEQTQNRALQLQTSAEVSRAATSILDVDELLPRIVDLIQDSFAYDHVQIFLLDNEGKKAVLQASTGEVGETMLRLKWALDVGSNSVIGRVTEQAEPVIALDTADAKVVHRPNPYLPDTRSEMAIPLKSRGRVVGALDVQSRQPNAFGEEDVQILTLLADQIAVALDNARLFEQTQSYTLALSEQVLSLQTMLEASQRFNTILDAQEILDVAAEQIVTLLRADHAGILLSQPQNPGMGRLVADHPPIPEIQGIEMSIEGAWWRDTYAKTRQPVVVSNVAESPLLDDDSRQVLLAGGINQVMIVPFITSGDQVIGSIGVDIYDGNREFSREDLTLVQLFAAQVASAYQNALSFTRAQQQAEDMSFLFNVTTAAAEAPDLETSMNTVIEQLQGALPSAAIGLYLADEEEGHLRRVAEYTSGDDVSTSERIPLAGWIARQIKDMRRPVIVPDLEALETTHGMIATNLRSLAATPLFAGSEVIGLILNFQREPGAYTEGNLQLLQALSGSISAVVQNILLLEEVQAANDRLRELDKIKSQFLANMSHELRTPLNSIIGFSRVILKGIDGPLTDMQEQDLETIHSSGQHLLNLINDILDQAKIEADKLSINVDWFDLNSVVEVARSMSIGLLKDKPVRLNVEAENDLPQVWGDEMRTRQVLINLLSNASKFTHEGSITITLFTAHNDDGPYVQVSVTDSGIGIPENKLDSVFMAFEQVDGSLTRGSGGTGLGLPISKSLIEMMGGELWVESTVNVGSTFSFTIPAYTKESSRQVEEDPETDPLKSETQLPYEEQAVPDRKVVLVIDGEVGMHQLYRRHLSKEGFTVEATTNAAQARDVLYVTQPDLIILDVATGDGQGWQVLEWLAETEDYRIPVIVASLRADNDRATELGAVACLAKPFLPDALVKLVREVEAEYVPERVLIIDDKPESMRLIVETLKDQPRFHVQTATSGEQGLEMIQRKRPDVVLLDLNMPELDGFAVLSQLRGNPRTQHIPVVIVTAEDELATERRADLGDVIVYSKNADDEGQLLTGVQTLLADNGGGVSHSNGDNAA